MKSKTLSYVTILAIICLVGLFYLTANRVFTQSQEKVEVNALNTDVAELLVTLKNKQLATENPEKLAHTIEELGQRQVSEAVPDLIDYLNFRRIHDWEGTGLVLHPLPKEGDYPAVGALFSIGKPSLPLLLKVIEEKEKDCIESKNALKTIQSIFRDDLSKGVEYLENAAAKSTVKNTKQNLQYAVDKTREKFIKNQKLSLDKK